MMENKGRRRMTIQRRIFTYMKDEGTRKRRKLHNWKIDNLCPVSGNTRLMK